MKVGSSNPVEKRGKRRAAMHRFHSFDEGGGSLF